MPPEVVPVLVVFIVIGLPVLSATLIKLARIIKGEDTQRRRDKRSAGLSDSEEARLMQDLHRGLSRMEQRIEALETIILEKEQRRTERTANE